MGLVLLPFLALDLWLLRSVMHLRRGAHRRLRGNPPSQLRRAGRPRRSRGSEHGLSRRNQGSCDTRGPPEPPTTRGQSKIPTRRAPKSSLPPRDTTNAPTRPRSHREDGQANHPRRHSPRHRRRLPNEHAPQRRHPTSVLSAPHARQRATTQPTASPTPRHQSTGGHRRCGLILGWRPGAKRIP